MAAGNRYNCDAPNCGKDCSEGDGRSYILQLGPVMVPLKGGSVLLPGVGGKVPRSPLHFHDYTCLLNWVTEAQAEDTAAMVSAQAGLKAAVDKATTKTA